MCFLETDAGLILQGFFPLRYETEDHNSKHTQYVNNNIIVCKELSQISFKSDHQR